MYWVCKDETEFVLERALLNGKERKQLRRYESDVSSITLDINTGKVYTAYSKIPKINVWSEDNTFDLNISSKFVDTVCIQKCKWPRILDSLLHLLQIG